MKRYEIFQSVRYWMDGVEGPYDQYIKGLGKEATAQDDLIRPTVRGCSVIMGISLMERLVMDLLGTKQSIRPAATADWVRALGVPPDRLWEPLFQGLSAIRHCFAHEYGRVTSRQAQAVASFQAAVEEGVIKHGDGTAVEPFFDVVDGEIVPTATMTDTTRRCLAEILSDLHDAGHV